MNLIANQLENIISEKNNVLRFIEDKQPSIRRNRHVNDKRIITVESSEQLAKYKGINCEFVGTRARARENVTDNERELRARCALLFLSRFSRILWGGVARARWQRPASWDSRISVIYRDPVLLRSKHICTFRLSASRLRNCKTASLRSSPHRHPPPVSLPL